MRRDERFRPVGGQGPGILPLNAGDRARKHQHKLQELGGLAGGDVVLFLGEWKRVTRVISVERERQVFIEGVRAPINILAIQAKKPTNKTDT